MAKNPIIVLTQPVQNVAKKNPLIPILLIGILLIAGLSLAGYDVPYIDAAKDLFKEKNEVTCTVTVYNPVLFDAYIYDYSCEVTGKCRSLQVIGEPLSIFGEDLLKLRFEVEDNVFAGTSNSFYVDEGPSSGSKVSQIVRVCSNDKSGLIKLYEFDDLEKSIFNEENIVDTQVVTWQ